MSDWSDEAEPLASDLAAQILEGTKEGIIITDAESRIVWVNPAFTSITQYTASECLGRRPSILASGSHGREFYEDMWRELSATGAWTGEIWNRKKDGTIYPEWLSITRVSFRGEDRYVGIFSDISRRKAAEARIQYLAHFDALTGLPNRHFLVDRANQVMSLCRRRRLPLSLMLLDLDYFKTINDKLGHSTGDEALKAVASRIQSIIRHEDTVARLGGDEYVILLPETNQDGAFHVASKILKMVTEPLRTGSELVHLSLSIGVAVFPEHGASFEILCQNADAAMYEAKRAGGNKFRFFTLR
ncbi:MAG TPA: sensor domain-containing diguanylate cyclase [Leptospiraceae bacterium]|nr:sensor domain-containing diguanylate cyclase [Leptospiraceae bacterium]HQI19296.1 sensor domain-containing diguanylate cyclase [Leptospiraceae bacterium]